ncbi:glutathione S-transferase family protein [Archangium lansingense]|uniref:Glutathione S-transferase family protein n=2 Tax=Archangium lansingense TaxID=2995310 RepID=A0ABT4A3F2_9BACT|nr:glutathione S-transferase family protein [Archangium lansinium]MCY1076182.1 glutathione S-transferase family protein [Archangium lansinium]
MITLHKGPAAFGVSDISPFCLKLETYLRMTGIPYTPKPAAFGKAPKGKIPFIEEDGSYLGDSQFIIEHLKRKHGNTLDAKLSTEDLAKGHLVRRTLEDSLNWVILQERWISDDGWRVYKPIFEALFPPVVGKAIVPLIRRGVGKAMQAHGMGRHRPEEILEMGKADVSAVAAVLGDKPFLLGDHPTSFDATLFAFILSILAFPVDSPLRKHTQGQQNLVRYCERFQQRYFAN